MTIKEMQKILISLGYSCGSAGADGIKGKATTTAIRRFQANRGLVVDGICGEKTIAELERKEKVNWSKSKYFKKEEFKCQCGGKCKGYPAPLDPDLINILNKLRAWLGKPIEISSGLRCYQHNADVGGVANSKHICGKAADIVWSGSDSWNARQKMIDKAYALGADYSYTNNGAMYGAVHIDIK